MLNTANIIKGLQEMEGAENITEKEWNLIDDYFDNIDSFDRDSVEEGYEPMFTNVTNIINAITGAEFFEENEDFSNRWDAFYEANEKAIDKLIKANIVEAE